MSESAGMNSMSPTQVSARAELHRVARALRQYLQWQVKSGAAGSVPAPAAEREAFERVQKNREKAKFARMKNKLMEEKSDQQPTVRAPEPESASRKSTPQAKSALRSIPGTQNSKAAGGKVSDKSELAQSMPWKTNGLGSRPRRRFRAQDSVNTVSEDANSEKITPESLQPSKRPENASAANSRTTSEYDESYESYAMHADGEQPPVDYDPGQLLDKKPPARPAEPMSKQQKLDYLQNYFGDRRRLGLDRRSNVVFGRGNPDARLVFVGGWPDASDEKNAHIFSSAALAGAPDGLLTKMIQAMSLSVDDVYLCSVVKYQPSGHEPTPDETKECAPYLFKQLGVIEPEVIVALGEFSARAFTGNGASSGQAFEQMRGQWQAWNSTPVMPTLDLGKILESSGQQERRLKGKVWQDLQAVMAKLGLG